MVTTRKNLDGQLHLQYETAIIKVGPKILLARINLKGDDFFKFQKYLQDKYSATSINYQSNLNTIKLLKTILFLTRILIVI